MSIRTDYFTSIPDSRTTSLINKGIPRHDLPKFAKWTTLVHFSDDFTSFDSELDGRTHDDAPEVV
jgi:hypothetical protein